MKRYLFTLWFMDANGGNSHSSQHLSDAEDLESAKQKIHDTHHLPEYGQTFTILSARVMPEWVWNAETGRFNFPESAR